MKPLDTYLPLTPTSTPTLDERVNFIETVLRKNQAHEMFCAVRTPEFTKKNWWSMSDLTFPHECDCWLSRPFGTMGLQQPVGRMGRAPVDIPEGYR